MKYTNLTATGLIKTGSGMVKGFIINSHTNGTLKLWDAVTATTPVLMNTYTFTAGSGVVNFPEAIAFTKGLFATVGGTLDITLVWD